MRRWFSSLALKLWSNVSFRVELSSFSTIVLSGSSTGETEESVTDILGLVSFTPAAKRFHASFSSSGVNSRVSIVPGLSGRGSLTMFSVWRASETRFFIDTFFPSSAAGAPFGGAAAGPGFMTAAAAAGDGDDSFISGSPAPGSLSAFFLVPPLPSPLRGCTCAAAPVPHADAGSCCCGSLACIVTLCRANRK